MDVKLYTTNCPRCKVLEKKLEQKGINFEKVEDFDLQEMIDKGFKTAPILYVDGEYMIFTDAVKWINNN